MGTALLSKLNVDRQRIRYMFVANKFPVGLVLAYTANTMILFAHIYSYTSPVKSQDDSMMHVGILNTAMRITCNRSMTNNKR